MVRLGEKAKIKLPRFVTGNSMVLAAAVIAVVLLYPFATTVETIDLPKEGEVAKEAIIAPFTFDIKKSRTDLERERREAMAQVLLVAEYEEEVNERVRRKFLDLRADILALKADETEQSSKTTVLRSKLQKELPQSTIEALTVRPYLIDDALLHAESALEQGILSVLLVESESELEQLRDRYNAPFNQFLLYEKEFITLRRDSTETTVNLSELLIREIVLENVVTMLKVDRMFSQDAYSAIYELLYAYLRPNVRINGEDTQRRKQMAAMAVRPTKGKVLKDSEIVRKHQVVTSEILDKIRSLHAVLAERRESGTTLRLGLSNFGYVMLVLIPLLFTAYYIKRFHEEFARETKHVAAFATIIVLQVAIIRIGLLVLPKLFPVATELSGVVPEYLIPIGVAPMLVTILFGLRLGFVASIFTAIFFAVTTGFDHAIFLYAVLGGITTGIATQNIRYRWDFFKAMPPVIIVYAVFIGLVHIIGFKPEFGTFGQNLGFAAVNTVLSTVVGMVLVIVFENLFDITTSMTLVELSDMNHPLLKRLSIEAAGTYNHSVLVANLAESAAARIHANALLARVSAYYHDIGKILKPNYFVENQRNDKNIHNKLSPSMSALVISSHVKEGLELSRKYKMPRVIRDAILQHHGTSTVSFFYEKALEQDPHKQVQEKDFRYPGPSPKTRENAIIMLADSVEAASRSLGTSSPKLLRELVKKIIHDKFASSQLDECNLTFQDLHEIIQGFMPVLQGIFHTRLEYPNKK